MEWIRGKTIGRGSFGTVNLATPKSNVTQFQSPIVVKSCEVSTSDSLKHEKQILAQLGNHHPQIVKFLGDSLSFENGVQFYNLFLEYAQKGSLADQMKISGGKFGFSDVKKYTGSILKGLCYVHEEGFVHGDVKLQNVLLFENGAVKIADFGLAKRTGEKSGPEFRGTPLYMSPEIVAGGEVGSPADVWALGCAVVEMVSGKPAWSLSPECDVSALLYRIGVAGESPEIPAGLCPEGRDFLEKCFVKDPNERWTARMLLKHPFVSGFEDSCELDSDEQFGLASPRCPLDLEFSDWESGDESTVNSVASMVFSDGSDSSFWSSVSVRFEQEQFSTGAPEWSEMDGWVAVR